MQKKKKREPGILIGIAVTLQIDLGSIDILTILSSNIGTWMYF